MTFKNSILSGTTLVREAIKSEGYVAGESGWKIERDGTAEFNSATVRGDWIVGDPDGAYIEADGTVPAIVVQDTSFDAHIALGLFGTQPALRFTTEDGSDYLLVGSSTQNLVIQMDGGALPTLQFDQDNGIIFFHDPVADRSVVFNSDGYLYSSSNSVSPQLELWNNLTLQNGWASTTGSPVQYKLFPDGYVRMRGRMTGGTQTVGTQIATLPIGYRPSHDVHRYAMPVTDSSGSGTVQVESDGRVVIAQAITAVGAHLDMVQFSTI